MELQEGLLNTNRVLLLDLLWYLKENKYGSDEISVFLEVFNSIYEHNDEHIALEPYLEEADAFAKRLIKDWKKAGKINFIRDINSSKHFLKKIKFIPYPFNNNSHGYAKDADGRYIPSSNPTYFCSTKGFYGDDHTVNILFDEVEKTKEHKAISYLSHETIHTEQDNFYLLWYIMNIDSLFSKMLLEGHAMKVARRIEPNNENLSRIPFLFDKTHNLFLNCSLRDYDVCKYLYFKFEFLLGHEFMNEWMTSKQSFTFLSKVRKEIDKKYGTGTFKYLYKNIQLILLLDMTYVNNRKLFKTAIEEKEKEKKLYCNQKSIMYMLYLNSKIRKYSKLLNSLSNENADYNQVKEELILYCKEFHILADIKLYQDITESDLEVCNTILKSNDHMGDITAAISNLEGLITDCLLKDSVKHLYKNSDIDYVKKRLNLYKHYVIDNKFNFPVLQNAMNNIDYISHLINEVDLNNENKLIKKQ
jgi:hypothetical protein